jgi:hypothetical protein
MDVSMVSQGVSNMSHSVSIGFNPYASVVLERNRGR